MGEPPSRTTLVVNEIYPNKPGTCVWQGEGPSAGRACAFIRFMGCNLDCHWRTRTGGVSHCDESQTWDASRYDLRAQGTRMEAAEIAEQAMASATGMVVITGGEPLLHQDQPGWAELLRLLSARGTRIEYETNGTQVPNAITRNAAAAFNVSPKLPSSGVRYDRALVPAAMIALANDRRAQFKFVCATGDDLSYVATIAEVYEIQQRRIWVMPVGDSAAEMLGNAQALAPVVATYGYNLTLRQQLLVYPSEREPR